jgi:hypothetical protein
MITVTNPELDLVAQDIHHHFPFISHQEAYDYISQFENTLATTATARIGIWLIWRAMQHKMET